MYISGYITKLLGVVSSRVKSQLDGANVAIDIERSKVDDNGEHEIWTWGVVVDDNGERKSCELVTSSIVLEYVNIPAAFIASQILLNFGVAVSWDDWQAWVVEDIAGYAPDKEVYEQG